MEQVERKKLGVNLVYGIVSQGITFVLNIFVSFFLPRYLGVQDFSYWQLFIFFVGYVCFFHFGLPDGVYLLNGGKKRSDIDVLVIAGQFKIMLLWQILISIIIVIYSLGFVNITERKIVLLFVAIYLPIINFNNFYGMIYQSIGEAKSYAISLIIDKVFFLLFLFLFIIFKVEKFEFYIGIYCVGRLAACIYSYCNWRQLISGKIVFSRVFKDIRSNIGIGINLMLSVVFSSLVLGIGRFVVDHRWGIEAFGIFSFSLTLSNFLLQFLNQISIVIFPALRNAKSDKMIINFINLRNIISIVLGLIPFAYLPLRFIVFKWLPQYSYSLNYVVFLLPMCLYDGRMQLLSITYMKVLREERKMLYINTLTFLYSSAVCIAGGYFFNNIMVVMAGMVSAVVIRSCFSEIYIGKKIKIKVVNSIITELVTIIFYWIVTLFYNYLFGLLIYFIMYVARFKLFNNLTFQTDISE